jgi:RNA polymerase sigma-70 factor (ECF subfamily)
MHDADDLLQNTIERLLSKPPSKEVTLMAWAFRVCRNVWIDEYRAKKVRLNASDALQNESEIDKQQTLDDEIAANSSSKCTTH